MKTIGVILTVITLLAGGGGATVYAAQDDLPGQALYPVKTASEDVRLWFNTDPQGEINLLMQLTETRVVEMIALANQGQEIPGEVALRLEQHVDQALQVAAGMDDVAMQGALLQIQTQLQTQEQVMAQIQGGGEGDQVMLQTRSMLQERLRLVDTGLADPQGFRATLRHENTGGPNEEPGTGNGPGNGAQGTPEPGGNGSGDGQGDGTGDGSGNGPGNPDETPGPDPSRTPGRGNGNGGGNRP